MQSDGAGRRFFEINHQTLSKNVKDSLSQKEFQDLKAARMYGVPENQSACPVTAAFLTYKSRCPPTTVYLFPKPLKIWFSKVVWYSDKMKTGKDTIGNFMKSISTAAGLEKPYTNYCIRVTVVNELDARGFTSSQIATVTGHKRGESIDRYKRKRDSEKRSISDALSKSMTSNKSRKDDSAEDVCVIIRNEDSGERNIQVPKNANIHLHFDGQFNDCNFNF